MRSPIKIDDYAQSMFRYEVPHPRWITRCAAYLTHIFGDAIQGATVVDYAFGRGNWSLAFIEAGAKDVIAIDAAESNVAKFSDYLRASGISGIHVVQGNILEQPIHAQADILWVYGILPCIEPEAEFLRALTGLWRNDAGIGLAYAYNRHSLRQVMIDLARQALVYDSYAAFEEDAFYFTPAARMRVRDDLTAPVVRWHTPESLSGLVTESGASPHHFVPSFAGFEGTENAEFTPVHLLFEKTPAAEPLVASVTQLGVDEAILQELGQAVLQALSPAAAKKFVIGLMNTHFSALASGGYESALRENFLFLFYACKTLGISAKTGLQQHILYLAEEALHGRQKPVASPQESRIMHFLSTTSIRI